MQTTKSQSERSQISNGSKLTEQTTDLWSVSFAKSGSQLTLSLRGTGSDTTSLLFAAAFWLLERIARSNQYRTLTYIGQPDLSLNFRPTVWRQYKDSWSFQKVRRH
jgi:hypothetical protein